MKSHHAWAKLDGDIALPLAEHGADVATVMEGLLDNGWIPRLEMCAGRTLRDDERQVLLALAFLHDLGKCNRGFWRRQFEGAPIIGHTSIVYALNESGEAAWDRLSLLEGLYSRVGEALFTATLSHHGRPVATGSLGAGLVGFWKARDGYDPVAELEALLSLARGRYPDAFDGARGAIELPAVAVSAYAGLLTLADWIGSDTGYFPVVEAREEGERRAAVAERLSALGLVERESLRETCRQADFERCFGVGTPYPIQALASGLELGSTVVIEAETGSGKTEAALWRFVALFGRGEVDSLYFALPTRTSAVQLHTRVQRMLDRVFGADAVQAVLAVPGYLRAGSLEGERLARFETLWPDAPRESIEDARWSSESPKRYLSARIAVGTVDQALMAGLRVRHAHLRASCLARALLVVDEVHASDTYMTEVLARVLTNHRLAGGHALLLSATLGAAARTRLLGRSEDDVPSLSEAVRVPYPALHGRDGAVPAAGSGRDRPVRIELEPAMDDPETVARLALEAADDGALVLVIRNTVGGATATLRALEALAGAESPRLFRVEGVPTLHHGRFAPSDRRLLDSAVERVFGKRREAGLRGVVAVGTQTLEMSLDLDADLMLTDLAPVDVLLQRIGRLHRHDRGDRPADFEAPRAVFLTPAERDLSGLLGNARHGLGLFRRGTGGVYPNLASVEATWRALEARSVIEVPGENRELVESATHPDALEAIVRELGWEAALVRHEGSLLHDRQLAIRHGLDPTIPFGELSFPAAEENVTTRLGAQAWRTVFETEVPGPFDVLVGALDVPAWMLEGKPSDTPVAATSAEGIVTFELADTAYRYDRHGLAKA